MATFFNRATLNYGGSAIDSNTVRGELNAALAINKAAIHANYRPGDSVSYAVTLTNSGAVEATGLQLRDDLGAYAQGTQTRVPLEFVPGSIKYFVDGVPQPEPMADVSDGALFIRDIRVPAGGDAAILYAARVNDFAPLGEGAAITNTVRLDDASSIGTVVPANPNGANGNISGMNGNASGANGSVGGAPVNPNGANGNIGGMNGTINGVPANASAMPANPNGAPANPAAMPANPNGAPANPGAMSANLNGASANPAAMSANPNGAPANPGAMPANLNGAPANPTAMRANPNGTAVNSNGSPANVSAGNTATAGMMMARAAATLQANGASALPAFASAVILPEMAARLSLRKELTPQSVSPGEQITYTLTIVNEGGAALEASEGATLSDAFNPRMSIRSVRFNGAEWSAPANYSYDADSGNFATAPGQLTVPAASFTQDTATGRWQTLPGESTIEITGTLR